MIIAVHFTIKYYFSHSMCYTWSLFVCNTFTSNFYFCSCSVYCICGPTYFIFFNHINGYSFMSMQILPLQMKAIH